MRFADRLRQRVLTSPGLVALARRILPRVDGRLLRMTGGRVSLTPRGARVLLLTTTGRRSGTPQSTPLIYTPHEGGYLVVGSNWGEPREPHWLRNLRADPTGTIEIGRSRHTVTATKLTGADRAAVWAGLVESWPLYADLAARAGNRDLPVVWLSIT